MSKPWDNEETPLTDAASQLWTTTGDNYYDAVHSADVRNIERRMRAAERLLDITIRDIYPLVPEHDILCDDIKAHLEAAKKEDKQ